MATRLARLLHGWRPSAGQHSLQGGVDRWQTLPHPVPGFSTIDGLPVPVVAVRCHTDLTQLEVVRGYHPTLEWPGSVPPPSAKRHVIPASSFNPHPRRELIVGGEQFLYNTVARSVSCRSCGKGELGFGFVSPEVRGAGVQRASINDRTLCEPCAEQQARVAAQ